MTKEGFKTAAIVFFMWGSGIMVDIIVLIWLWQQPTWFGLWAASFLAKLITWSVVSSLIMSGVSVVYTMFAAAIGGLDD